MSNWFGHLVAGRPLGSAPNGLSSIDLSELHIMFGLPLLVAVVTAIAVLFLCAGPVKSWCLDKPSHRSTHSKHTPASGGLAITFVCVLSFKLADFQFTLLALILLASVLSVLSVFDDLFKLPASARLAAHAAAAVAAVALIGGFDLGFAIVLAIGIAWMSNLFNFMDGADGLAAGMATIGFTVYALAAYAAGDAELSLACAIIAAAALGFGIWNLPPARIFMGDCGSIPLGFLAGAIGVYGYQRGLWSVHFPVLAFMPFAFDATITLLRRALAGKNLFRAHRGHFYQNLPDLLNWSPSRVLRAGYAVMAAAGVSALLFAHSSFITGLLVVAIWCASLALWAFLAYHALASERLAKHPNLPS